MQYNGAVFKRNGETFASERNSLVMAAANPLDASHMVLLIAGNDPLHTVEALNAETSPTPLRRAGGRQAAAIDPGTRGEIT